MKIVFLLGFIFLTANSLYSQSGYSLPHVVVPDSLYNADTSYTTSRYKPVFWEISAGILGGGVSAIATAGLVSAVVHKSNNLDDNLRVGAYSLLAGYIAGTAFGTYLVAHGYNKKVEWDVNLLYGVGGGLAAYTLAVTTENPVTFFAFLIFPLTAEVIYLNSVAPQPVYCPENDNVLNLNNKAHSFAYMYNRDRLDFKLLTISL